MSLLEANGLAKEYKKRRVVNGVTISVSPGEIVGLLGPNGAGKSSTLDILSGSEQPTRGVATVDGISVADELRQVHKRTALCPQAGGLWDLLTAREHIEIYAAIKSLPRAEVGARAQAVLTALDMAEHADKKVKELSGGNKRKLSVGIALLADSRVIFLDEPSCGVDPATRQAMWTAIGRSTSGRVVILTTHSMEEADVLAQRIGIMCNGRLHALGSPQALKDKHGAHYTLDIKATEGAGAGVADFVSRTYPTAETVERHGDALSFSIPRETAALAQLFGQMEGGGRGAGVQEYSISQTTLEQVFLRIAKKQKSDEDGGDEDGGGEPAASTAA